MHRKEQILNGVIGIIVCVLYRMCALRMTVEIMITFLTKWLLPRQLLKVDYLAHSKSFGSLQINGWE